MIYEPQHESCLLDFVDVDLGAMIRIHTRVVKYHIVADLARAYKNIDIVLHIYLLSALHYSTVVDMLLLEKILRFVFMKSCA